MNLCDTEAQCYYKAIARSFGEMSDLQYIAKSLGTSTYWLVHTNS